MSELTDFEKCTTLKRFLRGSCITCKLQLWQVSGQYGPDLIREANHYFQQYESDGEYDELLAAWNGESNDPE